jgi:hypothetical protein
MLISPFAPLCCPCYTVCFLLSSSLLFPRTSQLLTCPLSARSAANPSRSPSTPAPPTSGFKSRAPSPAQKTLVRPTTLHTPRAPPPARSRPHQSASPATRLPRRRTSRRSLRTTHPGALVSSASARPQAAASSAIFSRTSAARQCSTGFSRMVACQPTSRPRKRLQLARTPSTLTRATAGLGALRTTRSRRFRASSPSARSCRATRPYSRSRSCP